MCSRYKLEDEVFYLKEKVRELQTQSKWREARNKTDNAVVSTISNTKTSRNTEKTVGRIIINGGLTSRRRNQ